MIEGIIGKKLGMTQILGAGGRGVPVTAVQAGPCVVTQVRTSGRDGYQAVQLGFEAVRELQGLDLKRATRAQIKPLTKPEAGHLKRVGTLFRHLREFRADDVGDVEVGQQVTVAFFQPGDAVQVTGTSKGRGFAGVVKRHHFKGGPKTHGQSDRQRAPGAIGATTYPGRVLKGTRMAGHMGHERVTVRNLKVVQVDAERNLLFVEGAVPGPTSGLLLIRRTKTSGK
ncbi:MAG: 50S ribosomal protein L3 [Chloroflexi bacterium]|nr:50S ribosomal protein L3 [Chloroflexota bacterium]